MKRIPTFLAGMLTAAVIGGLGVGALAASGAVTFNASNLVFNGQQISAKGENYILASGQQVPASITYTDETGGGTTYLPVRRIADLLGIDIGWDSAAGAVTVQGEAKTPANTDNTASVDYSDWSAEEEAAYQEFKGMWEIEFKDKGNVKYRMDGSYENTPWESYKLTFADALPRKEVNGILNSSIENGFLERLAHEIRSSDVRVDMYICDSSGMSLGSYPVK